MDRLIAANSVPVGQADVAPGTGTPGYATNGNPVTNTPATIFPAYAWNQLQEEMMSILAAAGIAPDRTNYGQVLAALRALFRGLNIQAFLLSGAFTPLAGVTRAKVRLVGNGGAGGGGSTSFSGASGAAGGYSEGTFIVTPGIPIPVTIPAAAAGAPIGTDGATGGTVSFGAFISATGGTGGASNGSTFSGGAPGIGIGGAVNMLGGYGCDGNLTANGIVGPGGASAFGGGGRSGAAGGVPGGAPGSGGGGSYGPAGNGGSGARGIVIVEW